MPMESNLPEVPHRVTLEGRSKLSVSGVKDVESFDESMIVLVTSRGILQVCGENLHLQLLNLEGGQVAVEGLVDSMVYEEERSGGLLSRLWR